MRVKLSRLLLVLTAYCFLCAMAAAKYDYFATAVLSFFAGVLCSYAAVMLAEAEAEW